MLPGTAAAPRAARRANARRRGQLRDSHARCAPPRRPRPRLLRARAGAVGRQALLPLLSRPRNMPRRCALQLRVGAALPACPDYPRRARCVAPRAAQQALRRPRRSFALRDSPLAAHTTQQPHTRGRRRAWRLGGFSLTTPRLLASLVGGSSSQLALRSSPASVHARCCAGACAELGSQTSCCSRGVQRRALRLHHHASRRESARKHHGRLRRRLP